MTKFLDIRLCFALLASLVLAGCERAQAPPPPPGTPEVQVSYPVTRQVRDYEDFPGRMEAVNSIDVRARVSGYLEKMLFQEGAERSAWQCPRCGRVSAEGGPCPLDGTQMEERDDGLNLAVHQTLTHGGSVLALRHYQDLDPVEGIGALLRY